MHRTRESSSDVGGEEHSGADGGVCDRLWNLQEGNLGVAYSRTAVRSLRGIGERFLTQQCIMWVEQDSNIVPVYSIPREEMQNIDSKRNHK